MNFWTARSPYIAPFFEAVGLAVSWPAFSPWQQARAASHAYAQYTLCVVVDTLPVATFYLVILARKHGISVMLTMKMIKTYKNHTKIT